MESLRMAFFRIGILVLLFKVAVSYAQEKLPSSLISRSGGQRHDITASALPDGFLQPPKDAKPCVWWHWLNGNVSREGITKDLESMHDVGIAGVTLINPGAGYPAGPVLFNTPAWWELVHFAVKECERLGLDFSLANSAGWSESGGAWITPELSMQTIAWRDTTVNGPVRIDMNLQQPLAVEGYYKDIAVYAFPALEDDNVNLNKVTPLISSSFATEHLAALIDGKTETSVVIPAPAKGKPEFIQFEFERPFPSREVTLTSNDWGIPTGEWQVSDDGITFTKVCDLKARRGQPVATAYSQVKGKFYRLYITEGPANGQKISFSEIELTNAFRLADWREKAGFASKLLPENNSGMLPPGVAIASGALLNISSLMSKEGKLTWEVPEGKWTILRVGHTSTGHKIAPAPAGAEGLECDKLNPAAVKLHFDEMAGRAAKKFGTLTGNVYTTVFIDSWEAGSQNWTPRFREEFIARRGYDPLSYLPALTGRIIDNAEVTERFLWDIRRTIADLLAENHYGLLQKLSHQYGLKLQAEAPGVGVPTIADPIQCKQYTDIPMGEFWVRKGVSGDGKETASAAHIYGKKIASAEAFTAAENESKWANYPYQLKAVGDRNFILGFNRYFLHRFVHQPDDSKVPGLSLGRFGIHFERSNTWWKQSKDWIKYISRCQYLLQQGWFVGDICYYYGEDAPNSFTKIADLPEGYDYDNCDKDALLKRFSVRDNLIVLPDGMSYRLLVLPDKTTMSPEVIVKLHELVAMGAVVVGRKPLSAPGLKYYKTGYDAGIMQKITDIWGKTDGRKVTDNSFGKGKVYWGKPLVEILKEMKIGPDFMYKSESGNRQLSYIHRRTSGADIYFISSQSERTERFNCSFRVSGKSPECWDPATGDVVRPAIYTDNGEITSFPVQLDPSGSVFIVFRRKEKTEPLRSILKDGKECVHSVNIQSDNSYQFEASGPGNYLFTTISGKSKTVNIPVIPKQQELEGAWTVKFPKGWGAPEQAVFNELSSWTEHPDDGIRYFSGTATYQKQVTLPENGLSTERAFYLHINDVKYLAEVSINGLNMGVLWKPPYRLNITNALKPGLNTIEINVTNLWANRLIGDERLPQKERKTFSSFKYYNAESPLLISGLMGPVTIEARIIKKVSF